MVYRKDHVECRCTPLLDGLSESDIALNVPPALAPSVTRLLAGRTQRDMDVDALPTMPVRFAAQLAIRLLRWYRL